MIKLTAITAEEEPHSTVAAFMLPPDLRCDVVHAGDSRVYHFRGAEMMARTIDHSFVQRLIDEGKITEEAGQHPPAVQPADRLPGHPPGPADQRSGTSTSCSPATRCWPAATACGTTSRPRNWAPSCTPCRRARPARCWSRKARQRARGGGDNLSLALLRIDPLIGRVHQVSEVSTSRRACARKSADCISLQPRDGARELVRQRAFGVELLRPPPRPTGSA